MKAFVLDASALIRLYVPDGPLPTALEPALQAAIRGDALILAPELLWAEVGQVLWKKERAGRLARSDAEAILAAIEVLPIEFVPHRGLLGAAVTLARALGLSVYDGLYFALGAARGGELVTADDALALAWARRPAR